MTSAVPNMAEMKMYANPSMDFTERLEGDVKNEIMEELREAKAAGASPEAKSTMSRISTEASVDDAAVAPVQYEAQNLEVPVVIVTSEIHPWSKSGGLAIVAAQYAYNFATRGHRTMAIAPMYDNYEGAFYQCTKSFELFGGVHEVRYFHHFQSYGEGKGCDYVFVDHPSFRRPGGLYHNLTDNQEYSDNLFRFALFSLAALEVPVAIELGGAPRYGGKVMFIANDWQTGLLPVYMVHRHRAFGNYNDARCMYVIHNLGYQGCYPLRLGLPGTMQYDNFAQLGLPFAALGDLIYQYPLHERTFEGDSGETLNLTKGAIQCCDRIITVSPTYADEIRTPEGGFRLHDFVAGKSYFLVGILNGIDSSWNPTRDSSIASKFSADLSGKLECKRYLQRKLGLKDDNACILSFVGRLTNQKGIDLIGSCIHWIMEDNKDGLQNVQLVMMGNGEENFGRMLQWAESSWKGRICGYWGFSPQVEKEIIAGSDFFLMPSRYEPCGIPQMCAMMYGTIPIVHATGGLKDSVKSWYSEKESSTGFHVWPLNEDSLKKVIFDGLHLYFREPEELQEMRRRAMAQDFSWSRAIDDYERHFDWTMADPPFWGR